MGFYSEVDDLKLIERNIEKLVSLEMTQSERMLRVFQESRRRLRANLMAVQGDTFTEAVMELTLNQVEASIRAMNIASKQQAGESTSQIKEMSIEDLGKEIRRFSKEFEGVNRVIPVDQIIFSLDPSNLLLNTFEASIEAYTQEFRDYVQRELTQHIVSSEPKNKIINRILDQWSLQDWKVRRIVRTELHSVYNRSKTEGMLKVREDLIPDLQKTLIHPMDGRTAEDSHLANALKLVVDIDKPFRYEYRGKERVFMAPPDRPNDRSILVPFRGDWDR